MKAPTDQLGLPQRKRSLGYKTVFALVTVIDERLKTVVLMGVSNVTLQRSFMTMVLQVQMSFHSETLLISAGRGDNG